MKFYKTKFNFIIVVCVSISACNPSNNRKNKIAAKQSIVDTAKRFIIIKKDSITKPIDSLKTDSSLIAVKKDSLISNTAIIKKDSLVSKPLIKPNINQQKLVDFAKTLIGKPYLTGSKDPSKGFDNSGFVNYVFDNFKITTPRYSAAYIAVGTNVAFADVAEGNIILFSKTDSVKKVVSNLGIIVSGKGQPIEFIHCTSGKVKGVTITKMNSYYQKRIIGFRKVIN